MKSYKATLIKVKHGTPLEVATKIVEADRLAYCSKVPGKPVIQLLIYERKSVVPELLKLHKVTKEYGVIDYKLQRPEEEVRFFTYIICFCSMFTSITVGQLFKLETSVIFGMVILLSFPSSFYWLYRNSRTNIKLF